MKIRYLKTGQYLLTGFIVLFMSIVLSILYFYRVIDAGEQSTQTLQRHIWILHGVTLLSMAVIAFRLMINERKIINEINQTVSESKNIQQDLSYRIKTDEHVFHEFQEIAQALNAMTEKINTQDFELKEAQNEMDRRVQARTVELSETNERLKQEIGERLHAQDEQRQLENQLIQAHKMETLGLLAGGVAHDLNNVLSGVVGYPDLLLLGLPEDSPLRPPLETIKSSGQKATAIAQDLLALAKAEVAVKKATNLNIIITDYLHSSKFEKLKLFHPHIQIENNLEPELLDIDGSPDLLSKTVMNLVSNATGALHEGGKITLTTRNQYVDKSISGYDEIVKGEYVVLEVADNGAGLATDDMEKIFEPFYAKKNLGRTGTGLGMAAVWGTIKDHNGYVDVKSLEGQGTAFTLYFPVADGEVKTKEEGLTSEDYMGSGESILVVDDREEQREIAATMLKKLGYQATVMASGEEAVDYLKSNSADLVVLDMVMDPGIDGFETYKRIIVHHPNQKAIITSGFLETDRVKETQKLGAGQYVKKPYVLEEIGQVVKTELEK